MSEDVKNDNENMEPEGAANSEGNEQDSNGSSPETKEKDKKNSKNSKNTKGKKDHIDNINVMEMVPEDVPGIVIGLNPNDTLWRMETYPESKEYLVDLNRFSGQISKRLPTKLSEGHAKSILASLQLGTIRVYEKEVSLDPAVKNTEDIMNPLSVEARKIISELNVDKFKDSVGYINREELIYRCIDLEKREKNRESFLTVLRTRAKELTG